MLALLATGLFGAHPASTAYSPSGTLRTAAAVMAARVAKPPESLVRSGRLPSAELGGRDRVGAGSPPQPEEARPDVQPGVWADLDRDVPRTPRFVIRKLPAAEDADPEDVDASGSATHFRSRAPPHQA